MSARRILYDSDRSSPNASSHHWRRKLPSHDELAQTCRGASDTSLRPLLDVITSCVSVLRRALPTRLQTPGACKGAIVIVGFYGSRPVSWNPLRLLHQRWGAGCSAFLVDENGSAPRGDNWTVVVAPRCFSHDAQRSAHLVKTSLPLLLPHVPLLLYGDVKCVNAHGAFPFFQLLAPFKSAANGAVDLVAVRHPWFDTRSVNVEFEQTRAWMRMRNEPNATLHEIDVQEQWYRTDATYALAMDEVRVVPDTYCLAWASTAASRGFACRWSLEIARFSMREQLSFDHARRAELLNVSWLSFPGDHLDADRLAALASRAASAGADHAY